MLYYTTLSTILFKKIHLMWLFRSFLPNEIHLHLHYKVHFTNNESSVSLVEIAGTKIAWNKLVTFITTSKTKQLQLFSTHNSHSALKGKQQCGYKTSMINGQESKINFTIIQMILINVMWQPQRGTGQLSVLSFTV